MDNWVRFFIGTPRRFLTTLVSLAVVFFIVFPSVLRGMLEGLMRELLPLIAPLFQIGVIALVLVFMARALLGRKK